MAAALHGQLHLELQQCSTNSNIPAHDLALFLTGQWDVIPSHVYALYMITKYISRSQKCLSCQLFHTSNKEYTICQKYTCEHTFLRVTTDQARQSSLDTIHLASLTNHHTACCGNHHATATNACQLFVLLNECPSDAASYDCYYFLSPIYTIQYRPPCQHTKNTV